MSERIGDRRNVGRGRRQPVWYFVCRVCGMEADVLAKRKWSQDPESGIHIPTCSHPLELPNGRTFDSSEPMELVGLYLLSIVQGKKVRVEAVALRAKWEAARQRVLYGKICICGHPWWKHDVDRKLMKANECKECHCAQFHQDKGNDTKWRDLTTQGKGKGDDEVPF